MIKNTSNLQSNHRFSSNSLSTAKSLKLKSLVLSLAVITFAASSSAIAAPTNDEGIESTDSISDLITRIEENRRIVSSNEESTSNTRTTNTGAYQTRQPSYEPQRGATTIDNKPFEAQKYPNSTNPTMSKQTEQNNRYSIDRPSTPNYPQPSPTPNNSNYPTYPNTSTTTVTPAPSMPSSVDNSVDNDEESQVETQVNNEIDDQTHSDADSGQAVASVTTTDDDAIKSIENINGKSYSTTNLSSYAKQVNNAVWSPNMRKNTAMTVKLQTYLDWNHASPGPIDGGWGMNSKKALANFQAMRGLPSTGRMSEATWRELNKYINPSVPILIEYTLTDKDLRTNFTNIPSGSEAKSKLKGLYYQNIKEMLAERFHMDVRYLTKLNKGKKFKAGEKITVINVGKPLNAPITRVVAIKKDKMLYAYNGNQLVATYPTTVGSSSTPSPSGTYKIVNRVKMPWYKATVGKEGEAQKVYMLPPGPNNPVGVVWMGLSKPSYGIHGSPIPEGISRQASHGCIRLTNWDVLEVFANIKQGAKVELK